jgi:hypothetical protein
MLPDGVLSTIPIQAIFTGARALAVTKTVDYEDGGVALNDPSEGLLYQVWRCRLVGDDVVIGASSVTETILYSATGITEISFTFDQNMRPVLAFVKDGASYLRWYDSLYEEQVVTALDVDVTNPRVTLDDKRILQVAISDIILGYVRAGNLYYRQQRDRFETEYLLAEEVTSELVKIGMNKQFRLQFMLGPI